MSVTLTTKVRGSVKPDGPGKWIIVFDLPTEGRRKQKKVRFHCETEQQAHAELVRLVAEYDNGSMVSTENITVEAVLQRWMRTKKKSVKISTWENYDQKVRSQLIPVFGRYKIAKLTTEKIDAGYAEIMDMKSQNSNHKLSKQTALHCHRIFKMALDKAVAWGYLTSNPCIGVTSPRPDKAKHKVLSREGTDELGILLQSLDGLVLKPIIYVAALTGMRRGEILALHWSDIDFSNRRLGVKQTLIYTNENGLEFTTPKSESSERTIKLPVMLMEILKQHRIQQSEEFLRLGIRTGNDGLVFPVLDHRGKLSARNPRGFSKSFKRHISKLDITQIKFHELRHTHATRLLQDKIPIKVVSERLGHSNVTITMDIYQTVLPAMQDEVADYLDEGFILPVAEQDAN